MQLLELQDIKKIYQMGEEIMTKALDGVSLSIDEGEFLAIMGPSGSGKSTLMHVMGFLDTPTSGKYYFSGKEVQGLDEDQLAAIRNKEVGFVFQSFNLLPRTSALENVKLPLIYAHAHIAEQDRKSKEALTSVGLGDRMFHMPNELSGGQQQRVSIARALVNNPKVIFADEPTGNLDTKSSYEIMCIFQRLNQEGKTIIMVTHENDIAAYAKRIIKLRDGKIVEDHRNGKQRNPCEESKKKKEEEQFHD